MLPSALSYGASTVRQRVIQIRILASIWALTFLPHLLVGTLTISRTGRDNCVVNTPKCLLCPDSRVLRRQTL